MLNDLDKFSEKEDMLNQIHTAKDIFGLEKTNILIDNYKEEIRSIISNYPVKEYISYIADLV